VKGYGARHEIPSFLEHHVLPLPDFINTYSLFSSLDKKKKQKEEKMNANI
jgi:hypothetical protein